jgi:peroxiredoxin
MFKKFLFSVVAFSALNTTIAQQTATPTENKTQAVASNSFTILGTAVGYADGTVVDLLNGNNRAAEATTTIVGGKFTLTGKQAKPDFKLLVFDKSPSYVPLFLDNSEVTISASKDHPEQTIVTGSPSHNDFIAYSMATKPYESLFQPEGEKKPEAIQQCVQTLLNFLSEKNKSYIAPLAIFRIHQITGDNRLMEQLYSNLAAEVKKTPIGEYVGSLVDEARKDPMGKVIADFEQEDVNGNKVNIKSFRGKYVLIDFWASWCGPCRGENPNVVAAFNRFKDKNFTVLGISLDKSKGPWLEAIKKDGLTWTQLSDLKGWGNEVSQQFGIQSIPQNYLIDPNGVVIGKNLRGAALEAKLESVIK